MPSTEEPTAAEHGVTQLEAGSRAPATKGHLSKHLFPKLQRGWRAALSCKLLSLHMYVPTYTLPSRKVLCTNVSGSHLTAKEVRTAFPSYFKKYPDFFFYEDHVRVCLPPAPPPPPWNKKTKFCLQLRTETRVLCQRQAVAGAGCQRADTAERCRRRAEPPAPEPCDRDTCHVPPRSVKTRPGLVTRGPLLRPRKTTSCFSNFLFGVNSTRKQEISYSGGREIGTT